MRGRLPDMLDEAYEGLVMKGKNPIPRDAVDTVESSLKQQRQDALKSGDMDWFNNVADMESDLYRFKQSPSKMAGNLYKVDIPDDQIAKMLDWDKPLSEQSQHIQDLFPKMVADEKAYKLRYPSGGVGERQGSNIYNDLMGDIGLEYNTKLKHTLKKKGFKADQERTSKMLNEMGIPGIKYLDQGSRGKYHVQLKYKGEPYGEPVELSAKNQVQEFVKEYEAKGFGTEVVDQGTSNFVLFDDKIPKILEMNGKKVGERLLGKLKK